MRESSKPSSALSPDGDEYYQHMQKVVTELPNCPEYAKRIVAEAVRENIALRKLVEEKKAAAERRKT